MGVYINLTEEVLEPSLILIGSTVGDDIMKTLIVTLMTLVSTSAFAFFDDGNGNTSGGASSTMNGDAEARGVANFTMSFSGSGTTKGNFDADGEGSMQNMFAGEDRPVYYYRPETYTK